MYGYAIPQHPPRGRRGRINLEAGDFLRLMSGRGRHGFGSGYGRGRGRPFGEGFGPGFPFGGPPFGEGRGGPFGPGRGRGRKARRGDVRTAALILLAEEPRNGYQIMQELEQRSEGLWRPSPGSVYPALQQLEDEGLVRSEDHDGRKLLRLTEAGEAAVRERPADAPAPWEEFSHGLSDHAVELAGLMKEVAFAFTQVIRVGGERQLAEATAVLAETRRALYRILADGEPEGEAATGEATGGEGASDPDSGPSGGGEPA
jgi:DNA-binding PadR family transcriptional regulator